MAEALHAAAVAAPATREALAPATPTRGGARALTLALLPICAALALRALAIEPFAVRSESMLPTLAPGDRVFVNKLAYGARVPFTALRLPALREPARGDLVVFANASGERAHSVKRIVGLPGERVSFRAGRPLVNGVALEQWANDTLRFDASERVLTGQRERAGVREHSMLRDLSVAPSELETLVPAGHYFVLGDNRDHSADSRAFGPVPRERIVGSVADLPGSGPRFERAGADDE